MAARLGRLILLDDITQRVRMEEQMVQTEKLTSLGLLAAGVAHEVNTPLAVISNYIQMLAKQIPADDPRQKTIERIVKQTFRASEIVNNLLNFSRTGAAESSKSNLNSVLEETLTLVQHPFKTAQVNVVKNYNEKLPPVLGSTTRLQQVFLNLFMNARDAMPSGGMLEVRTAAHNGSVEIEVTDTGSGIPPEHLQRIFDPFFTTEVHRQRHRPRAFRELWHYQRARGQGGRALDSRQRHDLSGWNSPRPGKPFMPKGSILVVDDEARNPRRPRSSAHIRKLRRHPRRNWRGRPAEARGSSVRLDASRRQPSRSQRHRHCCREIRAARPAIFPSF